MAPDRDWLSLLKALQIPSKQVLSSMDIKPILFRWHEALASRRLGTAMRPDHKKGSRAVDSDKAFEFTVAFKQALGFHQTGRLGEAEKTYRQILETQPEHFDSLHLLGVVYSQRGKYAEAVRQIDVAFENKS